MWIKLIAVTVLITCTPSDQNVCFCSCRSLVDTIYSLKDEVQELKQVSAPIDEHRRHCCSKMRCFQQNARLGIIGTCHSCCPPHPPHSSRTTSAWGARWKRSSARGKSWSGSSGEFWRRWTTPAGMRPTSEIGIYLRVADKSVSWLLGAKSPMKCCQATVDQMDHQQRLTVIFWSQISW